MAPFFIPFFILFFIFGEKLPPAEYTIVITLGGNPAITGKLTATGEAQGEE